MRKPMKEWGPGPWDGEPEEHQFWTDDATGYRCAAARNRGGSWCGYVAISDDHPLHKVEYNQDAPERLQYAAEAVMDGQVGKRGVMNVFCMALSKNGARAGDIFDVHGSITYSGCDWPAAGFWYGFDCSHCDDVSPAYESDFGEGRTYRTLDYVKQECASLARQLQALVVPFPA